MVEFIGLDIPVLPRVAEFSAWVWWKLLAMTLVLGWGLWWFAGQASRDRGLRRVLLGGFGLRVLLGLAMYCISYWEWPIMSSLQRQDGFWVFGHDAYPHHFFAARFVEAWKHGIELPDSGVGVDYYAVVAPIYWLLGPHPLYPITLNGWLAACCGLLAYIIGRRLFDHRTAKLGACLVAFWPSTFIWSSQLLKDALGWFLVFASLALSLAVVKPEAQGGSPRLWQRAWRFLLLGLTVIVMTRIRRYLGIALAVSAVVVFCPMAWRARRCGRTGGATAYLVATGVIVSALLAGKAIDPLKMLSPRHPEVGRFELGWRAREHGDLQGAAREFQRALQLNASYEDAYLALGAVKVEQGRLDEALRAYTDYLDYRNPQQRRRVKEAIASIRVRQGEAMLAQGRVAEAVAAYEQAVELDPGSARHRMNLAFALWRQQPGGHRVLALLEEAFPLAPTEDDQIQIFMALARYCADQGEAALTQGRFEEAGAAYQRALRFDPESVLYQQRVAQAEEAIAAQRAQEKAQQAQEMAKQAEEAARQVEEMRAEKDAAQPPRSFSRRLFSSNTKDVEGLTSVRPPATMVSGQPAIPLSFPPVAVEVPAPQGVSSITVEGPPVGLSSPASWLSPEPTEHAAHSASGNRGGAFNRLARAFQRFRRHLQHIMREVTFESLEDKREGFIGTGGHFLANPAFPAVVVGLFAPFPWEWFDFRGSTGIMRLFGGFEMLLWYALLPAVCWGSLGMVKRRRGEELFLLTLVVLLLISMSWVVANIGTLFRLRLSFLLPLLLIGAAGREVYRRMIQRLWRVRVGPSRPVVEPAADATIPNGVQSGVHATVRYAEKL